MKKNFPLHLSGKDDARVVESVKNDVRKYVKRERRKALPEGVDFWDFSCKIGADQASAESKHLTAVNAAIDAVAAAGAENVFVEVISVRGHRTKKPVLAAPGDAGQAASSTGEKATSDSEPA